MVESTAEGVQLAKLCRRMGEEMCHRRLKVEAARLREYYQPVSRRMTGVKVRIMRPLIAAALKLCRLYDQGYRSFHQIEVRHNEVELPGLPPQFRGFVILQLSDLHIDLDPTLTQTIIDTIVPLNYDICVITGDLRNATVGEYEDILPPMRELLAALQGPKYGVMGNHDVLAMVPPLEEAGLRFLLNESLLIERDGAAIALAGIDDPNIFGTDDLAQALQDIPDGMVKVLLSHSPAIYREAARRGVDLVLAGHTHGGQVCLPGGMIVVKNDPSPRRYLRGRWQKDNCLGYTASGTGSCGIPVRYNAPPEVTLHRLISS